MVAQPRKARKGKEAVSAARVREVFDYNPETGVLTNRIRRPAQRCEPGTPITSADTKGYLRASVDGRRYRVHRLIWLHVTGSWPEGEVDHINRVKWDNRWCNLRELSPSLNAMNGPLRKTNTSGVVGVHPNKGGWVAKFNNRQLGWFKDKEAAMRARKEAEDALPILIMPRVPS